jgi:peptidyl-prolyl cis-trans isomerase B (cyclophilin B)
MSGSKRQRELARAKYERQQARRSANADKRKRNQRIIAAVVVVGLVFASIAWAVLNSRSGSDLTALTASPTPTASASTAASTAASPGASDPAATESGLLNCAPPGTVRPDDLTFSAAPTTGTASSITLATNCGDIVIALDPKAPKTVASEVFLANKGFYNNTECHRLTTAGIFVLQCGDPSGSGSGGPGYAVPDENLPAEGGVNYPAGTIAMANAGPGTSGSQFFIVYEDTTLPASYSIWGTVTSGLDIVKEIASVGVEGGATDGPPVQPVFIESATVQS